MQFKYVRQFFKLWFTVYNAVIRNAFSNFPVGDPKADLAFERQYEQQTYHVIPEVIKNFLQYFHKTISDLIDQKVYELQSNRVSSESIEQKIYEIQDVYENRFV